MAMFSIKRFFLKLVRKSRQTHGRPNFAALYKKGAFADAYAALCDMMKNPPRWAAEDGDLYTLWAELELLANEDAPRALQLLDKARQIGCSKMGYYYSTLAQAMWKTGNHEMSVRYLEKSVEADPSVIHLVQLGQVLWHLDDQRATAIWRRVLEKDPKNCLSHIYVGLEAAKSGDRGKALLMAKRAERLNPSDDDIFEIGRLYTMRERSKVL